MNKKKIRFAVIGCGLMGREFASAAARWCHLTKDIPAPEIVGVSDVNEAARAWFTDNFDSIKYSTADYRELLDKDDIDAVYCAVPAAPPERARRRNRHQQRLPRLALSDLRL